MWHKHSEKEPTPDKLNEGDKSENEIKREFVKDAVDFLVKLDPGSQEMSNDELRALARIMASYLKKLLKFLQQKDKSELFSDFIEIVEDRLERNLSKDEITILIIYTTLEEELGN